MNVSDLTRTETNRGLLNAADIDWTGFLNRPLFSSSGISLKDSAKNKTIMITGAGGSIGSALARRLIDEPRVSLVLLDNSERRLGALYRAYQARNRTESKVRFVQADISAETELRCIFAASRPHIVFHAAAMKHLVPLESDPFNALEANLVGSLRLFECAIDWRVPLFVNVSTDKAVNPTSVLGVSKRISELLLLAADPSASSAVSVRFGNVLGSSGSVVPLFIDSIRGRQLLQITDPDAARYFITLDEVVDVLLNCLEIPPGSLLLPDMGCERKIVDLGDFLMRLFSAETGIRYVGLQDGEKRHEQLTYDYEYLERTNVQRLSGILGNRFDRHTFYEKLSCLLHFIHDRRAAGLLETLSAIVPEFTPSATLLRSVRPLREV